MIVFLPLTWPDEVRRALCVHCRIHQAFSLLLAGAVQKSFVGIEYVGWDVLIKFVFMVQLLKQLHACAASAKVSGSVWQVMLAPHHLEELKEMGSPAVAVLDKWSRFKRFAPMDPAMASADLIHNAVSALFPLLLIHWFESLAQSSVHIN